MADQSRPVTGYPAPPAYPYAAPPPQSAAYYYAPPPPYAAPRAIFLRRLLGALIAAFIITGTIIFIAWIILRPQIPQIQADSLSVSSFNLTPSSLLTATWNLQLTIRNPNRKVTLAYDHIEAYLFYESESLSETSLPPFVQPTKNTTTATASFAASGAYVDGDAAGKMSKERREKGSVDFNVRMLARVKYRAGAWRARPRFLRVYCRDLQVAFSGNGGAGSTTGGPRQCNVGL